MKALISLLAAFALLGSSLAVQEQSSGQKPQKEDKVGKGLKKGTHKVWVYSKRTSKGLNHAAQRTERRYKKADQRKRARAKAKGDAKAKADQQPKKSS